jgi:hypothetical protein
MPTPPATCRAPVLVLVEVAVLEIIIMLPPNPAAVVALVA